MVAMEWMHLRIEGGGGGREGKWTAAVCMLRSSEWIQKGEGGARGVEAEGICFDGGGEGRKDSIQQNSKKGGSGVGSMAGDRRKMR